mgnify:CR=1 FL=1
MLLLLQKIYCLLLIDNFSLRVINPPTPFFIYKNCLCLFLWKQNGVVLVKKLKTEVSLVNVSIRMGLNIQVDVPNV